MAEEIEQRATASRYPAPPSFYQHFTPENIAALKEFQAKTKQQQQQSQQLQLQDASSAAAQSTDTESTQKDAAQLQSPKASSPASSQQQTQLPQLPDELKFLVPPRPPTSGSYTSFGDLWHIPERNITLEEAKIPQLYAEPSDESHSIDRAQELRRLSKSVLMNYLELVGVMGVNPGEYNEKITDLRNHFINLHQLINDYRPHQARETLIAMMEEQLETSRKETEQNRAASRKMRELLKGLSTYDAAGLLDATAMPDDQKDNKGSTDVAMMDDNGDGGESGEKKTSNKSGSSSKEPMKDEEIWKMLGTLGAGV